MSFTNYVDKILAIFDHLLPCVDILIFVWYERWQKVDNLRPPTYLIL